MLVLLFNPKPLSQNVLLVSLRKVCEYGFLVVTKKTDLELMISISGGDRNGLGELYERHAPKLHQIVSRFRFSDEEKEDIVQDLFLEVWEKAFQFNPEKGTVLTWLALRTRSRSIDLFRKKTRRDNLLEKNVEITRPRTITPPGPHVIERSELHAAMLKLDDDLVQVTLSAYFNGESTKCIAESLGIKQGTVKSRLRRAREVLYRELTGEAK